MGRVSKELKAVKEKVAGDEFPRENKDYYLKAVAAGEHAPPGWLTYKRTKSMYTREVLLTVLKETPVERKQYVFRRLYFMYPGPKPDPKWGPVTP